MRATERISAAYHRHRVKQNRSISVAWVLFLIFLTPKLAEIGPVAEWSWWWIFTPLLIPVAVIFFLLALIGAITLYQER